MLLACIQPYALIGVAIAAFILGLILIGMVRTR